MSFPPITLSLSCHFCLLAPCQPFAQSPPSPPKKKHPEAVVVCTVGARPPRVVLGRTLGKQLFPPPPTLVPHQPLSTPFLHSGCPGPPGQ